MSCRQFLVATVPSSSCTLSHRVQEELEAVTYTGASPVIALPRRAVLVTASAATVSPLSMQRETGSWPKPKDKRTWPENGDTTLPTTAGDIGNKRRKSVSALVIPDPSLASKPSKVRRKSTTSDSLAMLGGSSALRTDRRLTVEEEVLLVEAAQEAMRRYPGYAIASLKRNAKRRMFASTKRDGMSIVTHNILVGSGDNAKDLATLKQHGVTHILNVAVKVPNHYPDKLAYLKVELTDSVDCDILPHRQRAYDFLQRVEQLNGRCLVHCIAGVSRSVTIILMYLMERHHIRLRDAWEYMLSVRPFMAPNEGFRLQLAKLELSIFGESSMADYPAKEWDFYEWNTIKASCQRYEPPPTLCNIL